MISSHKNIQKIINTFAQRGFHTIGALKTNRLLYPSGMKKKLRELAAELSVTHREFDLVTVKKRNYYVYRYEGNLNGIENAVVLLSYPEKAFVLWSSIFVTLMANKIGGLQFGIYRNCQISSRVFHTAVAALPLLRK